MANSITGKDNDARKHSVFISVMGLRIYKVLKNLLASVKPNDKSFMELRKTP